MKKIIILIPIFNDWESLKKLIIEIDKNISEDQGVIYVGNPEILKKICPGVFGEIKPAGYCMIGMK